MPINGLFQTDGTAENVCFSDALREALPSAVIAVDGQARVVALSPEAAALLDLKPEITLRQPISALPQPVRQIILEAVAAAPKVSDRPLALPGQSPRILRVGATLLFSSNDAASGAVIVCNDVTSTKKLTRNMRRLDRLASIGTLSASMAHEIKNAFVPIKTFVELLLRDNQEAELAGIVSREIKRADSILSQMLKFAGPARPTFAPVDIHEIVNQSLQLIQPQLEAKDIAVVKRLNAQPPTVLGDAYQMEQVLLNLLFNALDAMKDKGELQLATDVTDQSAGSPSGQPARQLRLQVRDTGMGVTPENLKRLFEPFFTTKPNGTGLGLVISRRIVQEHGGSISVESSFGQGTNFTILLATAESPARAQISPPLESHVARAAESG